MREEEEGKDGRVTGSLPERVANEAGEDTGETVVDVVTG